jgi:hypothetical protein
VISHPLTFDGMTLDALQGWNDTSEEGGPFTVTKPDGVGALQFSPALYKSGPIPSPSASDLADMVQEFGTKHGLGDAFDETNTKGTLSIAAASYHNAEDFIRVWYASDGKNFALVTYVCRWGSEAEELADCEEMVRTIRFPGKRTARTH